MRTRWLVTVLSFALISRAHAQQPICIIDGIRHPFMECLTVGNPSRIQGIEILKGPAARAQYGAEGDGGVIMITLRPGAALDNGSDDPLAGFFFPPELVMANQQAIGLTERQRAAIQDVMKETQSKFVGLQFTLSGEVEKLQGLLQGPSAEEPRVQAQVDRVLDIEREIKHTQITMMIRVKNQLTESQQATLSRLRR
jgi:TonB-dependent SusC/RagA subfamily outer membrane receptor